MREQIKFGLVSSPEELAQVRAFAKSFDHEIKDDAAMPIFTAARGDYMIGFFNMIRYPIVCPAIHPKMCSHRDFFTCVEYLKQHFCLNSIDNRYPHGVSLLALPTDLPEHKKEAVERCGYANMKKEIWFCVPS